MINIIPSEQRYHADHGWLDTRWHFSFGDYYDEYNMNWGAAARLQRRHRQGRRRVRLPPAQGHGDRLVHRRRRARAPRPPGQPAREPGRRGAGDVGRHAASSTPRPTRRRPSRCGCCSSGCSRATAASSPRWEQRPYTREDRHNRLFPVVSPDDAPVDGTLTIDQDATIYVSSLDAGKELTHESKPGAARLLLRHRRRSRAERPEAARPATRPASRMRLALTIQATKDAELMLLDLP